MGVLLKLGFLVSGGLLIPPSVMILMNGPLEGGKTLIGEDNFNSADLGSPLLQHLFLIDAGKNIMLALICFCAAFFFDRTAQKLTALLVLALDVWALVVNVIQPVGPNVAPWPAMDGLFSNPVVLPIIGGQIAMMTLGLLTNSAPAPTKGKKK